MHLYTGMDRMNVRKCQVSSLGIIYIVFFALYLVSSVANAREWYIKPDFNLRLEYDDNIFLRREDASDIFGLRASFNAKAGTRTETSNIDLSTRINVYEYWGKESDALNRVDVFLFGHSDFMLTERSSLGLDAAYIHDNSVTSELDTTGLTQTPVPREQFNIAPHWSYTLTERQFIQAGYTHEEVDYDNTANTRLTSYKTDSINLSYSYQWLDNLQQSISFSSLWYQLSDFNRLTSNYNISSGLEYSYSETLSLNFMLGVRLTGTTTSFNDFEIEDSSVGPLFGFGFNKQFEYGSLGFDYNRSITPSSVGQLLQVDRINITSLYDVTEHLGLMLTASISKTDEGNNNVRNNNRIYYAVEPKIIWHFNRHTSLSCSYLFRMQDFDNLGNDAVSNSVYMAINYQWDQLSTNNF